MPVKVLLVDDSSFLRHKVAQHLERDIGLLVVGQARDGLEALEKIAELHPDVVVLDIEMPRLDGLMTLKRIMKECPTPVVMLSALTQQGARITIQSLMAGAVDFISKPMLGDDFQEAMTELAAKIKTAAGVSLSATPNPDNLAQIAQQLARPAASPPAGPAAAAGNEFRRGDPLIIIGASTGGPRAVHKLLSDLPAELPAAVLVVQHMPEGFTHSLAQRINLDAALQVEEATDGQLLKRGLALLAPGNYHLQLTPDGRVQLDQGPRCNYVRPALDITMTSAAQHYHKAVIGVILTGMGLDGRAGAFAVKKAGGRIVAEHESSCVVYGMPRAVIEAGLADYVTPLSQIAATLREMIR